MAVNRRNPDGVVRWHDAPRTLDNGAPNPFCGGRTLAQVVAATAGPIGPNGRTSGADFSALLGSPFGGTIDLSAKEVGMLNGTIPLSRTKFTENGCGSFFAPDGLGGTSGANWYDQAPQNRLDAAAAAVAASVNLTQISSLETREGFGLPTETSPEAVARFGSIKGAAHNTLDAFYTGLWPAAWLDHA